MVQFNLSSKTVIIFSHVYAGQTSEMFAAYPMSFLKIYVNSQEKKLLNVQT